MTLDTRDQGVAHTALAASRQRVEERLGALRQALQQSPAGRLGRQSWTLPLIAAAVGFSVAMLLRQGARRRRAAAGD